jgi:KaiC/GvpD/RAD55 family RecA-like ATPase
VISLTLNVFGELFDQNIPEGSNILLVGPPGAGKTIFCESLAYSSLLHGTSCLYVATDRAPIDIRNDFGRLGTDISGMESEKKIAFVDGYGWLTGKSDEAFRIENLANLTELIIIIEKALNYLNDRVFLVFDSLSPLSVHNPEIDVIKFLQSLSARMRNWKGTGIYTLQAGVHSDRFYNALAFLMDGVFEMKTEEKEKTVKRYFRISNLRFSAPRVQWIPFVIESHKGFRLEELEVPQ